MRINPIVLCVALAVPLIAASAQRRGGGGGGAGGRPATVGQIEDLNPARMLVDNRKKIGLADSTVNQLKALDKTISGRNKPLMQQYDSVRREMHFPNAAPAGGEMGSKMGSSERGRGSVGGSAFPSGGGGSSQTPEAAALLGSQYRALAAIGVQIRTRRAEDLAQALALLPADQAEKAKEFVTEQNAEFDKLFPPPRG